MTDIGRDSARRPWRFESAGVDVQLTSAPTPGKVEVLVRRPLALVTCLLGAAGCAGLDQPSLASDGNVDPAGGTGGHAGDASSVGAGGSGGQTGLACEADKVGVEGALDGGAVSALHERQQEFLWYPLSPPFQLGVDFGGSVTAPGPGLLRLRSPTYFDQNATGEMSGWLRLPIGSSSSAIQCATASVTRFDELSFDFHTTSVSELGACPGDPVAGEVTACAGPSDFCGGPSEIVSSLAEAEFIEPFGTYNTVGNTLEEYLPLKYIKVGPDHLITTIEIWLEGGEVAEGFVTIPSGPDEGAIYCVGSGSTVTPDSTGAHAKLSLKNLTRLGKCGPTGASSGSLSGCVR
jgi:hypothetical protein